MIEGFHGVAAPAPDAIKKTEALAAYMTDVAAGMRFVLVRLVERLEVAGMIDGEDFGRDLQGAVDFGFAQAGKVDVIPGELAFASGVAALIRKRQLLRSPTAGGMQ
jgi:hypothetical protein